MDDQLGVLIKVAAKLDQAKIAYMVSGSTAMNYYAQPRMTRDIDIVIELHDNDIDLMIELFQGDYYIDRETALDAVRQKSLFNIIHNDLLVKVDFIVRKDTSYRIEEFRRRQQISVNGAKIWLVSIEDLILSKLVWARGSGSEMQMNDVRNLIESADFDSVYLARWAKVLSVDDQLSRLKR